MNNQWQERLARLEVPPPDSSWEAVRDRLDDGAIGRPFAHRLADLHADPPTDGWNEIDARLSHSDPSVENRLSTLEIPPPKQGWERIARELDRSFVAERNTRRYRRVIAAAAMITVALALWLVFGRTGGDTSPSAPALAERFNIPLPGDEPLSLAVTTTDPTGGPDRTDHPVAAATFAAVPPAQQTLPLKAPTDLPSTKLNNQDRYIVWMTPEGQLVRLSKKLQSMVCCVSGEEEGSRCQDQVGRWQQQLAGSAAAHPGNFLDILDLVRALEDY
ncbi:MAG: hypothetical protein RJA57_1289 [Bacteroidota bacterium]